MEILPLVQQKGGTTPLLSAAVPSFDCFIESRTIASITLSTINRNPIWLTPNP